MTGASTTVRDDGLSTLEPAPVPSGASRRGGRWVLLAATLLILAQLGLRGWLLSGRQYYADDLRLLQLADRSPLFSPSYLLYDFDGHLMPGGFLVAGLVQRAAPLEWWPAAVSLILMQALAALTLLWMLRVVLGERPVLLVPLAFGLFTPLTLGSTTWWAAALNSMPLQISLAWYVAAAVRSAQTGRRRYALSGTAALAFGLAFYLKAVLLPPIAFVVVAVVLLRDGTSSPVVAALRRSWALWTGTAVVGVVWAVTYLSTRESGPVDDGDLSDVLLTITTGFKAIAPSVLGGPFSWELPDGSAPMAALPQPAVLGGAVLLLIACLWTSFRLRGAAAVWALVVSIVGLGLLVAALGRSGAGWGDIIPLAYRYYAAESVLLPLAGALLLSLPPRHEARGHADRPAGARRWWVAPIVAALTVGFVGSSVLSTTSHARAWAGEPAAEYFDNAPASLAAAGTVPLLDQPVPAGVLWPMAYPVNQISRVFASLPDRPPIGAWTSDLRGLDNAGQLRPGRIVYGTPLAEGPAPGCGWSIGERTAVTLAAPLSSLIWTVQLDYVADRDGAVVVALGDGNAVRAPVVAGAHTLYVRLTGEGATLTVSAPGPTAGLCVGGGLVGVVAVP